MIKDSIVVKRYAEAFLSYAKDGSGADKAIEDCRNILSLIRENPEFLEILCNPVMTYAEKESFVDRLLGGDYADEFKHFLRLLLVKRRINKLAEIAEYLWITYSRRAQVVASLKSAFTLDEDSVEALKKMLEDRFRKKVKFDIEVDKGLLGGVQITIGNTIIDGSLRRGISDMRQMLSLARVT